MFPVVRFNSCMLLQRVGICSPGGHRVSGLGKVLVLFLVIQTSSPEAMAWVRQVNVQSTRQKGETVPWTLCISWTPKSSHGQFLVLLPTLTIGKDLLTAPGPAFLTGGLREAELTIYIQRCFPSQLTCRGWLNSVQGPFISCFSNYNDPPAFQTSYLVLHSPG